MAYTMYHTHLYTEYQQNVENQSYEHSLAAANPGYDLLSPTPTPLAPNTGVSARQRRPSSRSTHQSQLDVSPR